MTHTRYAFIKANWHADIVSQALVGFRETIPADRIDVFDVPGAFEMPLLARDLAASGRDAPSWPRLSSSTAASTGTTSSPGQWWTG